MMKATGIRIIIINIDNNIFLALPFDFMEAMMRTTGINMRISAIIDIFYFSSNILICKRSNTNMVFSF